MEVRLEPADGSDLSWVESAVRSCPTSMAGLGGFYGHACRRLAPLLGEDRELLVVWGGGRRRGFVDVDLDADAEADGGEVGTETADLAYFVAPADRRRGTGRRALESVARRHRSACLRVEVDPRNRAGMALAHRAAFVEVGRGTQGEVRMLRAPLDPAAARL